MNKNSAYLIALPPGAGKTRIVLRDGILGGAPRSKKEWKKELLRTVIVVPSEYTAQAWLRETALHAWEQSWCRHLAQPEDKNLDEDAIRDMSGPELQDFLDRGHVNNFVSAREGCEYLLSSFHT